VCSDAAGAFTLSATIDGEPTSAAVAIPDQPARAVVVIARGFPGVMEAGEPGTAADLELRARALDAVVIAPAYRGTTPTAPGIRRGTPIRKGGEDLGAFARTFKAACEIDRSVLFSRSFGALPGTRVLLTEPGTFDAWFGDGGLYDLVAAGLILEPLRLAPELTDDLDAELGGTFLEQPAAWLAASPWTNAAALAHAGLRRIELHHGLAEHVPFEYALRMGLLLRLNGAPAETVIHPLERTTPCPEYIGTGIASPQPGESIDDVTLKTGAIPDILTGHGGHTTYCAAWAGIGRYLGG
jgi:hypothetical protein